MMHMFLVGTEGGLWRLRGDAVEPVEALTGRSVTALARDGARTWAIVEGRMLWLAVADGVWHEHASIEGPEATCLAPTPTGLLVGTEQAHLLRLTDRGLAPVESFDTADGRDAWYTPWGDPADVRSIATGTDGTIHVNVHVGGVVRSRDGGRSWTPTVDIDMDVHQVLAHPTRPGVVMAAAAEGFGLSHDGGDSWTFTTAGLHAHYLRAVAVADDCVFVSASSGPGGRRAAVYRGITVGHVSTGEPIGLPSGATGSPGRVRAPGGLGGRVEAPHEFVQCQEGLPTWFGDNVDTACLCVEGRTVVVGTEDGRLFRSADGGARWSLVAKGLPATRAVTPAG